MDSPPEWSDVVERRVLYRGGGGSSVSPSTMSLLTGVAEPGDLSPQHLRIAEVSSVHIPPVPLRNANDVWQEIGNDVYAAMRPVAVAAPRRELRRQTSAGGQSHNTGFTTAASVVSQPHSQLSAATLILIL